MQREVAAEILALMREYSGKLNQSVHLVKDTCGEKEFHYYRRAVGKIMGEMYQEIMWPIFHEHPDLEPETMKPGPIVPTKKETRVSGRLPKRSQKR